MAEKLGFDPLEFRLKNAPQEGTRRADGTIHRRIGCKETVIAAMEHNHYKTPLSGPNRGRGVASGFWMNGGGISSCYLSVNVDGTVSMVEGSPDIGGSRVSLAMQAAEVLGIPAEDMNPSIGDTDSVGETGNTGGSRVTYATGLAAYEAANSVKQQLVERAARVWDINGKDVEYGQGVLWSKSDPELRISFKDLAKKINETGGPVSGSASVNPTGQGSAFATHIVDVEVDPETGKVQILRYTAVQDAGKAVHPAYVENQIQGGVAQGIGWALNEEYFYGPQGGMTNTSLLDYRMPITLDLPMIDTVIVEVANPGHPYGVRGVGEVPIVPPVAAVADAIYNAVGVRMQILPMNPGNILSSLWEDRK
jgi:CO/xanthine dehydrogenase Mo-binding subunit